MKLNRINLIYLGVQSVARSMAFYKALGFQFYEKEMNPLIVFFDNQGTKLELFQREALAKDIHAANPPEIDSTSFKGFTLAINMKSKEEVDSFLSLVAQNNGNIIKPAERVFWGGYSGYFQDLDGYYWEVAYADSWAFDEQNMLIIEKN